MIADELRERNAPRLIVDAGKEIDKATSAKTSAPASIVSLVREWVTKQRGNDRYGR